MITSIDKNYNPEFRANLRCILDKDGKLLYRTTTEFFRDDIEWQKLAGLMCDRFENSSKVNVINHACSHGMEPLTLLISLLRKGIKKVNKFFPIYANDIDKKNIEMAKTGEYIVDYSDVLDLRAIIKNDFDFYFSVKNAQNSRYSIKVKKPLKDKILFSRSDVFDDVNNLSKEQDTVLLLRNFWPYLKEHDRERLMCEISKHLKKNSLLIIGKYDTNKHVQMRKLLDKYGFNEVICNVYSKD